MVSRMDPILLIPREFLSIAGTNPTRWLRADQGLGTTGARDFVAANSEYFTAGTTVNPSTQDFWVSFWVKPPNLSAAMNVFGDLSDTLNNGINIDITDGKISVTCVGDNTALSLSSLVAGEWSHVIVVVDKTNNLVSIYINGVLDNTTSNLNTGASKARASLIADDLWTITDGGVA